VSGRSLTDDQSHAVEIAAQLINKACDTEKPELWAHYAVEFTAAQMDRLSYRVGMLEEEQNI
jgi:hypothetical protein